MKKFLNETPNSVKKSATSWFAKVPLAGKICAVIAVVFLFFAIFPFTSAPEEFAVYTARVSEKDGELTLVGYKLPQGLKVPDHLIDRPNKVIKDKLPVKVIIDNDENIYLSSRVCNKELMPEFLAADIASNARSTRLTWFFVFAVIAVVVSIPNLGDNVKKLWGSISKKG